MLFFKPKRQRALEREIKRCGKWLTSTASIKLFADVNFREHRLALEKDIGGLGGFLSSSAEKQADYFDSILEKMKSAQACEDECRFACASIFAMFLECQARGYAASANKAIEVMERVQQII